MVRVEFIPADEEPFSTAGFERKAMRYVVKVHVPGLTGVIASLLGKTPPDSHVWILGGESPAFVKAESPLFPGGPTWRFELVSPIWPSGSTSSARKDPKDFQPAGRRERPASSKRAAKEPRSEK